MAKKNHFQEINYIQNALRNRNTTFMSEAIMQYEKTASAYMKTIFEIKKIDKNDKFETRDFLDKKNMDIGLCYYWIKTSSSQKEYYTEKNIMKSICEEYNGSENTYFCATPSMFFSDKPEDYSELVNETLSPRLKLCFNIIEECWRLIVRENKKDFPNPLTEKQTKELLKSYSKLMTQACKRKDVNSFVFGYMDLNWFNSMEVQAAFLFGDKDDEHFDSTRDKFYNALKFANIEFKDAMTFKDAEFNILHVKHCIRMQGIFLTELLNK